MGYGLLDTYLRVECISIDCSTGMIATAPTDERVKGEGKLYHRDSACFPVGDPDMYCFTLGGDSVVRRVCWFTDRGLLR